MTTTNNQVISEDLKTIIGQLDGCYHLRWLTPNESWQSNERRTRGTWGYQRDTDNVPYRYIETPANPALPIEWSESYGDWTEHGKNTPIGPDSFLLIEYASGSDYSGDLVNKSNYRVIRDLIEACELGESDWIDYCGGHGTYALAVRIGALAIPSDATDELEESEECSDKRARIESLVECITGLEDYPLADESDHSELEIEAQNEAWEDWARDDFKTELSKYFHAQCSELESDQYVIFAEMLEDTDWISDDFANTIAGELQNYSNTYWENEQGDSMYLDVERLVKDGLTPNRHWSDIAAKQVAIEQDIIREIHKQGTVYVLNGGTL